jgi:UPF0148 protein
MSVRAAGRIGAAAELLRKGAALLKEPCPKCGGVQLRYKGEAICISCGDLRAGDEAVSAPGAKPVSAPRSIDGLRAALLDKVVKIGEQLRDEEVLEKQRELLALLMDYLVALEKLSRIAHEQMTRA